MLKKKTKIDGLIIEWFGHSSIGIFGKKIIYIDPFSEVLKGDERKADLIISSHAHRDHFDINAINKLSKSSTYIIIKSGSDKSGLSSNFIVELGINESGKVMDIEIKAVDAYNTKRFRSPGIPFHPEGFGMGVLLIIEEVKFYYAGDTDFIKPMERLRDERIDIAFLPIGGIYTMDVEEAIEAGIAIQSRIVIPVHYNHLKGTEADPIEFKKKFEGKSQSEVIIL
jgi:L-ascorbate metabolism protein UlaG (beta-lactamase superfamily)